MSSAGEAVAPTPLGLELIESATRPLDIPREHRIFVNRNLRLDRIELVGFDMDYTLALYNQARIEELSMRATLHKLVTTKGYPEEIRALAYDPTLAIRGLVVDRVHGNIFKPDRYGFPGRARHGLTPIDRAKMAELYQRERMRLSARRYAWIDSLFALPEAVLYANLVDYFDRTAVAQQADVRRAVGGHPRVHRPRAPRRIDQGDRQRGAVVVHRARPGAGRDAAQVPLVGQAALPADQLGVGLHEPRDELPARRRAHRLPVVAQLLRHHRGQRRQAGVLHRRAAVRRARRRGRADRAPADGRPADAPFARGRIYSGGNIRDFQERARASGDRVLFVGDHIYGDMLRSRKSSNWRTAMVLQELEHEVVDLRSHARPLARLDQLDSQLIHLDSEINERQTAMRTLQKLGAEAPLAGHLPAAKRQVKDAIEKLRAELRAATAQHRTVESEIDDAFNPHWGPLFREGYEVSKFGEQVEAYACVYTSRVSNFRFCSPMQYFRGPRDRMPHERG